MTQALSIDNLPNPAGNAKSTATTTTASAAATATAATDRISNIINVIIY